MTQSKVTQYDVGKVKQAISELDAIVGCNNGEFKTRPLVARLYTAASHVSDLRERIDDECKSKVASR